MTYGLVKPLVVVVAKRILLTEPHGAAAEFPRGLEVDDEVEPHRLLELP